MIFITSPPTFAGIDSLFGFQFAHAFVDPLLKTIAEPPLDVVCNSDRCSFEESGSGRPGFQSDVFRRLRPFCGYHFEEASASEQAEMASAIKLQVTANVNGSGPSSCRPGWHHLP
jgi:hypothetical protein